MNDELKPCPFCGSANVDVGGYDENWAGGPAWEVVCDECGATPWTEQKSKAAAVAAWNQRAQPAMPQPDWSDAPEWAQWAFLVLSHGLHEVALVWMWTEQEPMRNEVTRGYTRQYGHGKWGDAYTTQEVDGRTCYRIQRIPMPDLPLGIDWRLSLVRRPDRA